MYICDHINTIPQFAHSKKWASLQNLFQKVLNLQAIQAFSLKPWKYQNCSTCTPPDFNLVGIMRSHIMYTYIYMVRS